ncbi:MAG: hypothetical protein JWR16_1371 [Nevskia sp.]|nr:hypothetical protein [Nevskia sp.]
MQRSPKSAVSCALSMAGTFLVPTLAFALDTTAAPASEVGDVPSATKTWDVTAGGGLVVRPTYEGSDRYRVAPVPFVNVIYDDMISLGVNGLSAYWHHDGLRIGGGLTFDGGRKDHQSNGIFNGGDDRLRGLGNINSALGLRVFASYRLRFAVIDGTVTKLIGGNNDGLFANLGISLPYKLTDRFILTPHVSATWANQSYMQTYFGVTPTQASNSSFPEFSANSGFKDVGVGINATYLFNRHWFIRADANVKEFTGDARKSPLSISNTNATFMTIAGYHF